MKKFVSFFLALILSLTSIIPAFAEDISKDILTDNGVRKEYNGHIYIRVDYSLTWKEAKAFCEENGGYLATVTSFEEQTVLMRLIQDGTKNQYWLGATDEESEGNWHWVTDEIWNYRFTGGFDNSDGVEDYLQMYRTMWGNGDGLGRWNDNSNVNAREGEEEFFSADSVGFIYESGEIDSFKSGEDYTVDGNIAVYNNHTYTLIEESMTWKQADEYCKNHGGYLATVTNAHEQQVLTDLIQNGVSKSMYWLGGSDADEEGTWKWSNGEKWCYYNENYQFDNFNNNEDYLQIQRVTINGRASGYWNDVCENNTAGESWFYYPENVGFILETGTPFTAEENDEDVTAPIIYIIGRTPVYTATGEVAITENSNFVTDVVMGSMDELEKAILTDNYDDYCELIYNEISARYANYRLNNDGEVDNGSTNHFSWSIDSIPTYQSNMYSYQFQYDARLDPCKIADDLNEFIEAVKQKTGSSKIHLVSRCLGCNIASAYLAKYGYNDVLTNVFFASAATGYSFVGEMFAGKFSFEADAVSRYVDKDVSLNDEVITEFLRATCVYAKECGVLDIGTAIGQQIFNKIAKKIVPQLLIATYATCPGYWSMVNDENYEEAKEYIFGTKAKTIYKKLVEKIDDYHYNVSNKLENILADMKKSGVKINIICKYGFQVLPFIESSDEIGDNRIEVTEQSFGATCCKMEEKFGLLYLYRAEKKGTDKYISPDRQIDSSTALFPDCTWYIKNIVHNPFYDCFNVLMQEMCFSENQMTVDSDESYPQYLYYDTENSNCVPLTEENMNTIEYNKNLYTALKRFINALVAVLRLLNI